MAMHAACGKAIEARAVCGVLGVGIKLLRALIFSGSIVFVAVMCDTR